MEEVNLEIGELQTICLENNLIDGLINLALKHKEDFLTPISKIWALAIDWSRKSNYDKVLSTTEIGYRYLDAIITINIDQISQWLIESVENILEFDPIAGCGILEQLLLKQG